MIHVDIRTNVDQILADVVELTAQIKSKATIRALNLAATKIKTEAGREVRKIYNIKLGAITKATTINKAHRDQAVPRAQVKFAGRPISLIEFSARAVNPWNKPGRKKRKHGGGVSVQVKVGGSRRIVKHAFITTTKAGYRGVFLRESIDGAPKVKGGEQTYRDRIVTLRSISLPKAVRNEIVMGAIRTVATQTFESEVIRQVKLLTVKK